MSNPHLLALGNPNGTSSVAHKHKSRVSSSPATTNDNKVAACPMHAASMLYRKGTDKMEDLSAPSLTTQTASLEKSASHALFPFSRSFLI
jgi:hypothetical protein